MNDKNKMDSVELKGTGTNAFFAARLLKMLVQGIEDKNNQTKIYTSLKFITFVRCIYAVLVLIYTLLWFIAGNYHVQDIGGQLLLGCVIEIFVFTALCSIALLRKRLIKPITYLGMVHDAFLAAFVVLLTGYHTSPFMYLFLIIPLYGGIILQRRGGIIAATIVSAVLVVVYHSSSIFSLLIPDVVEPILSMYLVHQHDIFNRLISLGLSAYGVGILTGQLAHLYARVQANLVETEREFLHLRGIYEHMVNALPIGVVILNPMSGRLLYANPSAKQLLSDMMDSPELAQHLSRPKGESQESSHSWIVEQNNRYLRVASFELPVDALGNLSGYHISDVTDVRYAQIERNRRQRLELLGEFSAKVAHEIRNPLACISGCNEMLQAEELSDERRQIQEMMGSEIERLNALLNDILLFSRKPKLNMVKLHPARLIERQRDIFLSDPDMQAIKIEIEVPDEIELIADENSLSQIVMTLWRNSSEATEGKGTFWVTTNEDKTELVFKDDGPGLSKDVAANVFEPFYTTKSTGTGLGLSIARQLAIDNELTLRWDEVQKGFCIGFGKDQQE